MGQICGMTFNPSDLFGHRGEKIRIISRGGDAARCDPVPAGIEKLRFDLGAAKVYSRCKDWTRFNALIGTSYCLGHF